MPPEITLSTDDGSEPTTARADRQTDQEAILRAQIREGVSELERPAGGLLHSALSAGLDIGFGPLFMAVVLTVTAEAPTSPIVEAVNDVLLPDGGTLS